MSTADAGFSGKNEDGNKDDNIMLSKYRGCLMGALVGDCIGGVFEVPRSPPKYVEIAKIEKVIKEQQNKPDRFPYTDDTAMCHALSESLISRGRLDIRDVAQSFADKFYSEKSKQRTYARVKTVFAAWKKSNYKGDLFGPSKAQFDGMGSIGNGGGMRIAGVPLFCGERLDELMEIAKTSTQLTHYNVVGYNGAILQAYAIFLALHSDVPDASSFLDKLTDFARDTLEKSESDKVYTERLGAARKLLNDEAVTQKDAVETLGHSVKALDAIPMAIFCAARALRPIPGIEVRKNASQFERTIIYAISMGGDTDTIATMAGAISGAWFGIDHIPPHWQNICEAWEKTLDIANKLYACAYGEKETGIRSGVQDSPTKKQKTDAS